MPSRGSGSPSPHKSSDQSGGGIALEVRNELQRFAEDVLQPQLSQFAESLQQDVFQPQLSWFAERLRHDFREEFKHCFQDPVRSERGEPEKSIAPPVGDPQVVAAWSCIPPEAVPTSSHHMSRKKTGYLRAPTWATLSAHLEDEFEGKASLSELIDRRRPEKKHERQNISTQGAMLGRSQAGSERLQANVTTVDSNRPPRAIPGLIVTSKWFERAVAIAILLNAIYIGVVTQYMAVNELASTPLAFQVTEGIFLIVFTAEISLKLYVYRCSLFSFRTRTGVRNEKMYWNLLDCLIIGLQVMETILSFFTQDSAFNGLTVIRVLRLLRLVRIVRIVKVMRFVADLNMIINSIWRSISLFFWSVVALGMLNFICSVYFTEFVLTSKVNNSLSNRTDIDRYFGSLTTTMISLFQAVTGGVDWGDMTHALSKLSSEWAIVPFLVYVAFNQIAMLNVISGVFLETAMEIAREEKDVYVVRNARLVFKAVDHNKNGTITWEDFEGALNHPHMINFFEAVAIRSSEARTLFDLLDTSGDGTISADEFLNGCLRVRGPSKALDLLVLSREVSCLFERHIQNTEMLEKNREIITENREAIMMNCKAIKTGGKFTETSDDAGANSSQSASPADTDDKPVPSDFRSNTCGRGGSADTNHGDPFSTSLPGECPP